MTILDPNPDDELDDPYGFKNGWWYYIKSFFCTPYNIFHPKQKRKMTSVDWYMLVAMFMAIWMLMFMRYWNE